MGKGARTPLRRSRASAAFCRRAIMAHTRAFFSSGTGMRKNREREMYDSSNTCIKFLRGRERTGCLERGLELLEVLLEEGKELADAMVLGFLLLLPCPQLLPRLTHVLLQPRQLLLRQLQVSALEAESGSV